MLHSMIPLFFLRLKINLAMPPTETSDPKPHLSRSETKTQPRPFTALHLIVPNQKKREKVERDYPSDPRRRSGACETRATDESEVGRFLPLVRLETRRFTPSGRKQHQNSPAARRV